MKYASAREVFGQMPRLRHKLPGRDFDPQLSEVLEWLGKHPVARQHLFQVARESGAIVFDGTTGTWQGVNWKP